MKSRKKTKNKQKGRHPGGRPYKRSMKRKAKKKRKITPSSMTRIGRFRAEELDWVLTSLANKRGTKVYRNSLSPYEEIITVKRGGLEVTAILSLRRWPKGTFGKRPEAVLDHYVDELKGLISWLEEKKGEQTRS